MSEKTVSPANKSQPPRLKTKVLPWALVGITVITVAIGGVASWGATAPLASAVVTSGKVTVDSNKKQIQHLEGGIVEKINIRDGSLTKAGEVLIRLDDTRAKASLAILDVSFREELAKEARLEAERDELNEIPWSQTLLDQQEDPEVAKLMKSQTTIFRSRQESLVGQIDILKERILQLAQEVTGLQAQKSSAEKQIGFINEELTTLKDLLARGQTTRPRILALQREAARLEGQHGEFIANIARSKKAIGETKLEIIQSKKAFRTEVVSTLREVQAKINDLRERRVAAADLLNRLDIRAPVAGKVVGLTVHAPQAIVRPGEPIMEIVPSDDRLIVEVQVQPQDVDNVAFGQQADVRFVGLQQNTTPTVNGYVTYVSADALNNPQNGASFYLARVQVKDDQLERLNGQKLQPGMPAEVMIKTGERTAINYIVKPILDSMNRAWRED